MILLYDILCDYREPVYLIFLCMANFRQSKEEYEKDQLRGMAEVSKSLQQSLEERERLEAAKNQEQTLVEQAMKKISITQKESEETTPKSTSKVKITNNFRGSSIKSRIHNRVIRLNKNTQLCVNPWDQFSCKFKHHYHAKEKSPIDNLKCW